ncbi:hypothetical protein PA10_00258 [Pseudomonas phage pPa_SNUABM_DT01]|nr:hypothetical protein PA10_00258 [Pseudomonas phage pPa_SNUABM_DT01]
MRILLMAAANSKNGYPTDVLADIISQFTFKNNSIVDEKSKRNLTFTGGASVVDGQAVVPHGTGKYTQVAIDYFGAGDFTYEIHFTRTNPVSGEGMVLPCHWANGGLTSDDNRFSVLVAPDGSIGVCFATSGAAGAYTWRASAANVVGVLNREYHVVVERYNGIIKVFVDRVEVLSWSQPAPLWATTGNYLRDTYSGTGNAGHKWRNLRVAKRALYKHVIPAFVPFPAIP